MSQALTMIFDTELLQRYDIIGPRYTSYPTAVQFRSDFNEACYRQEARSSNEISAVKPLSLYFHIPFCATVCYYCACNKIITKNRQHAAPYLERLQKEITLQSELYDQSRVVQQLHWGGGTPSFLSDKEMRLLMEETRRHFNFSDDDRGEYSVEVDPREADAQTVMLFRQLGFNRLSIGIQDFDPSVQHAVNRIQSEAETSLVVAAARREGFRSINFDLIYGLPKQTVDSFSRTMDKVISMAPDRLSIFNYAHLPELFKTQRQIDIEDLPSAADKLAILQMTIVRLTEAGYVYIGMDHFARPEDELALAQRHGTLTRNFQGYTTHADCDLVAMGVTAISKIGQCYSQNTRTLASYHERIDRGQIPIDRGLRLTADDQLRRDVIMQLICLFTLDFVTLERRYDIDFCHYFADELERLTPMAVDGLIGLSADRITVLPAGKLLIRNICMVFDSYLGRRLNRAGPAQATRFSRVI